VLRHNKKVTLSVSLSVVAAGASGAKTYSKKVAVKRR